MRAGLTRQRVAGVAVAAFLVAVLAVQITTGTGIVHTDAAVRDWMRAHQERWLHDAATGVIVVLSPPVDFAAVLLLAAFVARRRRDSALWWGSVQTLVVLAVVVLSLKYGLHRRGPREVPVKRGYFPSGHTSSAAVCGAVALRLLAARTRRGITIVVCITLLVALCLLYVSDHWLSDVIAAGFVAAGVLAATPAGGASRARGTPATSTATQPTATTSL